MKVNTKVKLENPNKQQAMAPSRSLPRSASELGDPPSPFSSNPAHNPVSVPTTPGLSSTSCSSFGRMMRSPPTDTPPITPTNNKPKPTPTPTPAAAAAAYYASLWSPRRLMQRAARAFRRRGRGVRTVKDLAEERASVLNAGSSKVSDAAAVLPPAGAEVVASVRDGQQQQRHDDYHHEVVPEKIIREDAPPVVAEDKETAAAASTEEEVESPKKGAATAPVPAEAIVAAAVVEDDVVADKFVTVVKEAIKKHHEAAEQEQDEKKEAMRRFQGSRVKTAMEARPESEQPRRREVARSNDVIEEARTKLLEKRQCSRVKALVGAFETVMDTKKDAAVAVAGAGKPQHHYRKSV